jgi:hypothetical protein
MGSGFRARWQNGEAALLHSWRLAVPSIGEGLQGGQGAGAISVKIL